MFEERWLPVAAGAGIFVFLFALLPPAKVPLWVVNLSGGSVSDAADAHGGVELTYWVRYDIEADPVAAVDQVLETLRRRLDARGIDGASVVKSDDSVIVRLPGVTDDEASRLRDMLAQRGDLEFRVVQHGSEVMRRAGQRARFMDLEVMNDSWHTPGGDSVTDHYLIAPTRVELEAVLGPLADGEVFFGYEFVAYPAYGGSRPEGSTDYWRSYALRREPYLDSDAIDSAALSRDEYSLQPQVMVHFTNAGAAAFTRLTEQYTGYKLAIVLDDQIRSAPVIQQAIPGGSAVVHMGAGEDPEILEARARDLVAVLHAGSLQSPIALENERAIAPALSEASLWTARALFALLIGLLVAGAVFGAQRAAARIRR